MGVRGLVRLHICFCSCESVRAAVVCAVLFASVSIRPVRAADSSGPVANHNVQGIAWDVKGAWQVEGRNERLLTGDAISPGVLLVAGDGEPGQSITVLLPDGQEAVYQCFTAKDCARGFRVPMLFHAPDPFVAAMLARIRTVLVQQRDQASAKPAGEPHIARDEAVAVLGPGNRIEIGGLAANLSNGEYSGDLRPLEGRYPEQSAVPLVKSGRTIGMTAPGPGLYLLTIVDAMKWPRIEFMIAVVPAQGSDVVKDFKKEHALLAEWKENYFGWPTHDFQRAYLESLMQGIQPEPGRSGQMGRSDASRPGITPEPTFTPRPGFVAGDLVITLECASPGAVIHYTEGGSQPMEDSPVYRAPIVMKTVPITIKAFAESPGKKDSAVVTGNFRIQEK